MNYSIIYSIVYIKCNTNPFYVPSNHTWNAISKAFKGVEKFRANRAIMSTAQTNIVCAGLMTNHIDIAIIIG